MKKSKGYYATVTALVAGFVILGPKVQAGGEKFYSDLIRLDRVVTKISENYVEDVSSEELVDAAIAGIRGILDPHTAYFTPKDYEDLKINTEGEFGGLGIQIGVRDQILTVISPLSGTPAHRMGMRAGDKIIRIDTTSTKGMTIDDAVELLRGKPGAPVKIQIIRNGVPEPMDFNIVREVIRIESVPYAAMLNDSIGYIKVTQFAKRTAEDLELHIKDLRKKGMKGMVLDLRVNPGGLLNQAIEVSELFLSKGKLVVFTKGRVKSQNQEYPSRRDPLFTDGLVVMVNENSASASEIVAGAIQDWDRGVVMGETSYGKGSVQTILPLDGQQNTLKLTTAYYYTPSGRCINKPENAVRFKRQADSAEAAQGGEVANNDTLWFKTKTKGRKVLAGGGITPDVKVMAPTLTRFDQELLRKTMFFNFIIKEREAISAKTKVDAAWEPSQDLIESFRKYVFGDTAFSKYRSGSLLALENLLEVNQKERVAHGGGDPQLKSEIEKTAKILEQKLRLEIAHEFEAGLPFIKGQLKAELMGAVLNEDARTAFELTQDPQIQEAIKYLGDPKLIAKVLKTPKDKG